MNHSKFARRKRMNNQVPEGWLNYIPVNTWIENTRIIPFKCPLRMSILKNIDEEKRFSLTDLIEYLNDQKRKIGLIIDLTDTHRYYDSRDVTDRNIEYYKIRVPGHQDVPEKCWRTFSRVVRSFLYDNHDNDKLIGIHCTHGINRSGYFIIRYLIEILGQQPDDAINAFNQARGHQIEKYIDDLRRRIPKNIRNTSTSDSDNDDSYSRYDRPLPYTRPISNSTTCNDLPTQTSNIPV